jgi:hypothetical protein
MCPRQLYVSFERAGKFGWSIVPLLGPLDEKAIRTITATLEERTGWSKPVTIIAITVLEDQADNPRLR